MPTANCNPAYEPLAIIGMACRFPGAGNLDEFWEMLVEGRCGLGEMPADRFDRSLYFHPQKGVRAKSYTSIGGVIDDRPFDHASLPLSQDLIDRSHNAHLELLQVAADALRAGGLDPFGLSDRKVGVYVGNTPPSEFSGNVIYARGIAQTAQYLREVPGIKDLPVAEQDAVVQGMIETVRAALPEQAPAHRIRECAYHAAALVAEGFNLDGPAMSFDAACASSLRALGHAARALQTDQIDLAIVGGASFCHADNLILFSAAQSLSATGSRPFDAAADGLVAAEGYVAVVVKTLKRAIADNDPVLAVVRGIGVASDGKGKSLWAPRMEGQVEAILRAYSGDLSLADIQYLEMHATSTQVGDATEMNALVQVFDGKLPPGRKLPVGSVKANIGHTIESAGLASLVKTVLAMRNGLIPPQINITKLNTSIEWDKIPFTVPLALQTWDRPAPDQPRRAAVNAFGIGGLNVHVVLEEFIPRASQALVSRPSTNGNRSNIVASHAEPIAIVGMGAVLPGARTIEQVWDLFHGGISQIRDVPAERWDRSLGGAPNSRGLWQISCAKGGFITDFEYDWRKHKVPPKQLATADPLQFMFLDAAEQALRNAGYAEKTFDRKRTGVVVGTVFGGEFTDNLQMGLRLPDFQRTLGELLRRRGVAPPAIAQIARAYEDVLFKHLPALIDETGSFTASTLSSRITKTFDLMGGATSVDAGETSAMAALSCAIDLLRGGDCDMMICAAGQRHLSLSRYQSLTLRGHLSGSEPHGPFALDGDGFVPGEGAGVLLLKRLSDAQRDGNTIHAIIHGVGVARKPTLADGMKTAIERSLADARIAGRSVSLVETAAAGLPSDDADELTAIRDAYGAAERGEALYVGAVAGQIGNTGGGSGMVSLIRAVSELNHVEAAPNRLESNLVRGAGASAAPIDLPTSATKLAGLNDDGRLFAGVDSHSQFGVAYHVIIEGAVEVPRVRAVPPPPDSKSRRSRPRIVRIGAENVSLLLSKIASVGEHAETAFADADALRFTPADARRVAIVAASPQELRQLCTLAAKQLEKPEARPLLAEKGIFYGEPQRLRPRVAFLFPGQGSQFIGMLKSLVDEYAPAASALREVDAILARHRLPTFAQLAWDDADPLDNGRGPLGSDVWRTQLSLIAADAIAFAAVTAMGFRADRVAGHSFGELAALMAAGAWSFDDAVRATVARCSAIDACTQSQGLMLSTSAPANVLAELCRQVGDGVYVSHLNAPDQTVAGGVESSVRRLAELVAASGFQTRTLDVPAAFHTPLMEEVKEPFGRALKQIPIEPPAIPFSSSVTNRYVADPEEIRQNLVVQMTQPVHYADLVARWLKEGINVFIEVGPKQVLTGLHKRIAGNRAVSMIACDHKTRPGFAQLIFVQACLEAAGALDPKPESSLFRPANTSAEGIAHEPPADTETRPRGAPPVRLEQFEGLNVLRLCGAPFEIGRQHGTAQAAEIRAVLRRYADLAGTKWDDADRIAAAAAQPESFFGEDELEELRGIATGAGVTPASLVAHNLRLYLDAGAGGTHFALTAAANRGGGLLHAVNEDLQRGLSVKDLLDRNVQVRFPAGKIPCVTFGVAGQVGGLNGINVLGVTVSTVSLLDVDRTTQPAPGDLPTVLVKHVLEQAADVDAAVRIIRESRITTASAICVSDQAADRLCYIEYDGREMKVQHAPVSVVAANHRLLRVYPSTAPAHSVARLERLRSRLGGGRPSDVSAASAQEILRDRFDPRRGKESAFPTLNTVRRVDNQISIVMEPAVRNVWVTRGPLSNGRQDQFICLNLEELFAGAHGPDGTEPAATTPPERVPIRPLEISAAELAAAYADAERGALQADAMKLCRRHVLRIVESPLTGESAAAPLAGSAMILGANDAARSLAARLRALGINVTEVRTGENAAPVIAAIDDAFTAEPVAHLFIMTGCDTDATTTLDEVQWSARRRRGVTVPYQAIQRWYQHLAKSGMLDRASLTAATRLGGDFGLSGNLQNVEGGALAGFVKGIHGEIVAARPESRFRAKVIDTSPDASADDIADAICSELADGNTEIEAGFIEGRRYAVRPIVAPASGESPKGIPKTGAIVLTGGARGVTAVVARELGTRYGLKLHLIGASPTPEIPQAYRALGEAETKELRATVMKEALAAGQKPIDAWTRYEKALEIDKTLRELAAAGVHAVYHACDISDRPALSRVLDSIRAQDGPVRGIIHGAGFERASRFEKKQIELVERTIAAKVDGAAALMALTEHDPLAFFVAFGSVSGRFGGVGQTDYCLANEMLAKLIDWYRKQRPACGSSLFHWHAWDDVGMAVRPESQHIRQLHNIRFMPSKEGAQHLIDELEAGLPEGEIVVTEWAYCKAKYGSIPAAEPQPVREVRTPSGTPDSNAALRFPMLDTIHEFVPRESLNAGVILDPHSDVFLMQHRFRGRPLMPIVAALEIAAEAASKVAGARQRVVQIRDVEILTGLRFHIGETQEVHVRAVAEGRSVAVELTFDLRNRKGQILAANRPYLRAVVDTADRPPRLSAAMPTPADQWVGIWYTESDAVIHNGPALRTLHELSVDGEHGWGRLTAPSPSVLAGPRGAAGWILPSAMLDGCLFAVGTYSYWKITGRIAIPASIDAFRIARAPREGERCLVHVHLVGREENFARYDFSVFGDDGSVIMQCDGFRDVTIFQEAAHAV